MYIVLGMCVCIYIYILENKTTRLIKNTAYCIFFNHLLNKRVISVVLKYNFWCKSTVSHQIFSLFDLKRKKKYQQTALFTEQSNEEHYVQHEMMNKCSFGHSNMIHVMSIYLFIFPDQSLSPFHPHQEIQDVSIWRGYMCFPS